eukprot:TRINITY_DN6982_c0_g1_i2.p1 TRINITY_DN6982_c0_g1~~TRINITY_DN6982_c0_g1_i2.p1  ORF type:complete len:386 (-),score=81.53 TRINITY_DN6982_c0_g1_i2:53-1210(-)
MAPSLRMLPPLVGCAVFLAARSLSYAFMAVSTGSLVPKSLSLPRLSQRATEPQIASSSSAGRAADQSALCGAVAAVLAAGGLAARSAARKSRASAAQCQAFSSGSSGFMGTSCASSYLSGGYQAVVAPPQQPEISGVASMGMKAQTWWIRNNGFDGPAKGGARIFDSRRRESRRRGEELFRHDVDNFELCMHNLIPAPGSHRRKIIRGRGKYGHHGRTCGWGISGNGAKKRGRRTLNPGYQGGATPLHLRVPKLSKADMISMKQDPYAPVYLGVLNMCEDGDEVDYQELFIRGLPVRRKQSWRKIKIKGSEEDEFTVKNLTVYAHVFEPIAREKIEKNGGKCIRLTEVGSLPVGSDWLDTANNFEGLAVPAGGSDAEAEGEDSAE